MVAAFTYKLSASGMGVTFKDASTGPVVQVMFDCGDGTNVGCKQGSAAGHNYKSAGSYTVVQTVKDADDNTATSDPQVLQIGVPPPPPNDPPPPKNPPPPPPGAPAPPSGVTADSVTLTGTLADGTAFNLTVAKGQRAPLVPGNRNGGSVKFYGDGLCARIENAYAGVTQDLTGTFHLVAGDVVLFDGALTIWAGCATRPFWLTQPTVIPDADLSLFPKLGPAPTASLAKKYVTAHNDPMGWGYDEISIGNPGESARLGPVPEGDADWLTNPSADNAVVVRGMADASSVWPYHAIDFDTQEMLDVTKYPHASFLPACFGASNPIVAWTTACPLNLGQAQGHDTNRNALAAVIFGTDYDREELAMWNNYVNCLWQNPGYRLPSGVCSSAHGEIPRAIGRGLTSLLYAAKYSTGPAHFDTWVHDYIADVSARMAAQTGIHVDQLGLVYENDGFAPWQNHVDIYGLGLAIQFGHTEAQSPFDYLAVTLLDSILAAPHEFATLYSVSAKDAAGNVAQDWVSALKLAGAALPATVGAALACAENSQELRTAMAEPDAMHPGDFDGHPASPTGYCAMARGAIVMVANHGTDQTRAQAALAVLEAHDRADYSQNPKYNLKVA